MKYLIQHYQRQVRVQYLSQPNQHFLQPSSGNYSLQKEGPSSYLNYDFVTWQYTQFNTQVAYVTKGQSSKEKESVASMQRNEIRASAHHKKSNNDSVPRTRLTPSISKHQHVISGQATLFPPTWHPQNVLRAHLGTTIDEKYGKPKTELFLFVNVFKLGSERQGITT